MWPGWPQHAQQQHPPSFSALPQPWRGTPRPGGPVAGAVLPPVRPPPRQYLSETSDGEALALGAAPTSDESELSASEPDAAARVARFEARRAAESESSVLSDSEEEEAAAAALCIGQALVCLLVCMWEPDGTRGNTWSAPQHDVPVAVLGLLVAVSLGQRSNVTGRYTTRVLIVGYALVLVAACAVDVYAIARARQMPTAEGGMHVARQLGEAGLTLALICMLASAPVVLAASGARLARERERGREETPR